MEKYNTVVRKNGGFYTGEKELSTLAINIRCFRNLFGLTQEDFAKLLGLGNEKAVSILESGNLDKMSADNLYRIYYYVTKCKEIIENNDSESYEDKVFREMNLRLLNETGIEIDKAIESKQKKKEFNAR